MFSLFHLASGCLCFASLAHLFAAEPLYPFQPEVTVMLKDTEDRNRFSSVLPLRVLLTQKNWLGRYKVEILKAIDEGNLIGTLPLLESGLK